MSNSKKTAIYHQELPVDDKPLHVLAEHADGTVDLGPEGGEAVVTNCPVNTDGTAKEGTCTIQAEKPKEATKDK